MKTSRRRTVGASVRVALTSGAAAVGWLFLGATGAHASEQLPSLPAADAVGAVTQTVDESVPVSVAEQAPVRPLVSETLPSVAGTAVDLGEATASPVQLPQFLPAVAKPVLGGVAEAVSAATAPVSDVVASTVDQVAATPVVSDVLPQETLTRPVETVTGVVNFPAPAVPQVVEPVLVQPSAPSDQAVPGAQIPQTVAGEPVVADAVEPIPAASSELLVLAPAPSGARADTAPQTTTPIAAPSAASSSPSSSRAVGPSPSEVLKGLEQFAAGATHSVDDPGTGSTVSPARSGGALQPGPAPSSSAGNSGGSGTPLRGFGPDSWPQMPADASYLGLFPQRSVATVDPFFAGVAEPPAAPSFDPGSTPD